MPNRILKESICSSDNIDELTAFQETVFYRLIVNCDDFGRMDARAKLLSSKLFPLKEIKPSLIDESLRALMNADLIVLYEVDGKPYLQMKTWETHQQVRAKKSKYPSPDEGICNQLISNDNKCPRNPIQSNTNPIRNTKGVRFTPPTLTEVTEYCNERNNGINPQHFIDYYETRGWELKPGQKVKDWKACIRTWEQRQTTKKVSAQNYGQRDYSGEQNEAMARMMALGGAE